MTARPVSGLRPEKTAVVLAWAKKALSTLLTPGKRPKRDRLGKADPYRLNQLSFGLVGPSTYTVYPRFLPNCFT